MSMAYLRNNGGSLLNGQSRATGEDSTKVGHVPGRHLSIFGGVLAERRKNDTVVELSAADLEGLEQRRGMAAIGLRVVGSSCRGILCRREVRNLVMPIAALIEVRIEVRRFWRAHFTHVGSRFVPEGGGGDLSRRHGDSIATIVDEELLLSRVPAGFIFIRAQETKEQSRHCGLSWLGCVTKVET
jgi:hypothetical protein